ncbi:hypothetical protein [Cupriavidus basilensis]|uniref:hypothetical protein n=1 Tax=Cupriavidus basilensis TaxID=68895 RepID=UPI000314EC6A|nr:hypothetical protein [Cupriavidus basilensis]
MDPAALPRTAHDDALQALHTLAARAGLLVHWEDAQGRAREVEPEVLRAILGRFGLPSATVGQCEAARAQLAAEDAMQTLPPLITADQYQAVPIPSGHTLWHPARTGHRRQRLSPATARRCRSHARRSAGALLRGGRRVARQAT